MTIDVTQYGARGDGITLNTDSPRKGFEDIPFVTGEFLQKVQLDRVQISGFQNPRIINVTDT